MRSREVTNARQAKQVRQHIGSPIEHEPIETYSNDVRHVKVPDADGNAIAFAEPPDAASASPRSAGTGASS